MACATARRRRRGSPGDLKAARNALRAAKDDEQSTGDLQREAADALVQIDRIWDEEFDPRTRSSLVLTLSTALYAWGEPSVQDATAAAGEDAITPEWLLDGSNTLYLVAPSKDQQRLQGLFTALIQSVVDEAFARSSRNGSKAIDPRLLLVIDEAANTAPLPSLDAIASSGPGQGVTTLTVLQTLSQATHAWGADKAQSIIGSHRAKVFGAGISDTETLRYLDTVLGEQAAPRTSVSKDRGKLVELGSKTESIEHRKLQGPHQVREAKEGTGLLIYGNLRPGRIVLRPWFKDRRLTRLRNGEAPTATIALQVARRQLTRSTTWMIAVAQRRHLLRAMLRGWLTERLPVDHSEQLLERLAPAAANAPEPAADDAAATRLKELQLELFDEGAPEPADPARTAATIDW